MTSPVLARIYPARLLRPARQQPPTETEAAGAAARP
jgi:hypothetical protein